MDDSQWNDIKTEMREKYPNAPFKDIWTEPIWFGRSPTTKTKVEGRRAIIGAEIDKPESQRVFCVASEQYQIVRPELAQWQFEQSLKGFVEFGKPAFSIKAFGDGAKWLHEALFPNPVTVDGQQIKPKAGVRNSLDLAWEYSYYAGALRMICTNGMYSGYLATRGKKKHRLNLDIADQAGKISDSMGQMSDQFGIWESWAELELDKKSTEVFLETVPSVTEAAKEKILELPLTGIAVSPNALIRDKKFNVFELHNAVTQYFTHEVTESVSRVEREDRAAKEFHKTAMKLAA